jgi:hypothetical protein
MISFRSKTKDFKSALNSIRAIHKGKHIHTYRETCEITLIDNYVRVSIPGSAFGFACESKGTAKATLLFRDLYSLVDHHSFVDILVDFYDESLKFGAVQVKAKTSFFKSDRILRTIVLPNKYSDLDLLLLKNEGYTKEELEFNNLLGLIDHAERRVFCNVRQSALYLKEYGISAKDIKQLLIEKLGVKLDLDENDVKLLLGAIDYV